MGRAENPRGHFIEDFAAAPPELPGFDADSRQHISMVKYYGDARCAKKKSPNDLRADSVQKAHPRKCAPQALHVERKMSFLVLSDLSENRAQHPVLGAVAQGAEISLGDHFG